MILNSDNYLQQLYETDDYLWLQETVKLLKAKQFNQLDNEDWFPQ